MHETPHHAEVARRVKAEVEAGDHFRADVDHRSQPWPAERQSRFSVYYHQVELCFVTLDAFQGPHRARPLPPGAGLFIGISLSVTPHGDLVRVQSLHGCIDAAQMRQW